MWFKLKYLRIASSLFTLERGLLEFNNLGWSAPMQIDFGEAVIRYLDESFLKPDNDQIGQFFQPNGCLRASSSTVDRAK